jgi:hypothetical protein
MKVAAVAEIFCQLLIGYPWCIGVALVYVVHESKELNPEAEYLNFYGDDD